MTPVSRVSFSTRAATLQLGSPRQHHLRAGQADGEMRPTRAPSGVKTGHVDPHAVAAAEVDLDRAPPIGRFAQDDVSQLQLPGLLLLPGEKLAQVVIFAGELFGLRETCRRNSSFSRRRASFWRTNSLRGSEPIDRLPGHLLGGAGEAEQRQEKAADAQLKPGGGPAAADSKSTALTPLSGPKQYNAAVSASKITCRRVRVLGGGRGRIQRTARVTDDVSRITSPVSRTGRVRTELSG